MIKFIELDGTTTFKWEYRYTYTFHNDELSETRYESCCLTGVELIEWLQKYGKTPYEMFKNRNVEFHYHDETKVAKLSNLTISKAADEWLEEQNGNIKTWTCVGMNGGYVLMSDADKENVVEFGSAPAKTDVNVSNRSYSTYSPNISMKTIRNSVF